MARDGICRQNPCTVQVISGFLSPVSSAYKKADLAPAEDRLRMCQLSTEDSDWIDVDDWEIRQKEYTPTAQMLQIFKERLMASLAGEGRAKDIRVMLLAGADLIQTFDSPTIWDPLDVPSKYINIMIYLPYVG